MQSLTYDEILDSMRSRYRELAGFDADNASDIGIRLKVLAAEAAVIYDRINELGAEVFPQTSSGKYLELHAAGRAIVRKPAIASRGSLRFSRETPAYSDITIPAGILCSTKPEPQVFFITTQAVVLKSGQTWIDAPAVASSDDEASLGAVGNVAAGSICLMITPSTGITSVTNPAVFYGGVDKENDVALRARLLASYQNISNGTNSAFYYDLAMSHEGVSSVNILPRRRGRGTVDVVVACRSADTQNAVISAIQADLNERKEINVDVLVTPAIQDFPAISVEIAIKAGYNYDLVAETAKSTIQSHLEGLAVGAELFLASVGSRLMTVDGIYNYRIITPTKDFLTVSDHVVCPGTIAVTRMAVG